MNILVNELEKEALIIYIGEIEELQNNGFVRAGNYKISMISGGKTCRKLVINLSNIEIDKIPDDFFKRELHELYKDEYEDDTGDLLINEWIDFLKREEKIALDLIIDFFYKKYGRNFSNS